jgi:hypothetical protein
MFSYLAITSVIPSKRPTEFRLPDGDRGARRGNCLAPVRESPCIPCHTAGAKYTAARPRAIEEANFTWRYVGGRADAGHALPHTGGADSSLRAAYVSSVVPAASLALRSE